MPGDLASKFIVRGIQNHLWFLESLDQINRAIQEAGDLEQMMTNVLDAILAILDCDRVWLIYPCDPNAASWQVPMERTKPEYAKTNASKLGVPMEPAVAQAFADLLAAKAPVKFAPNAGREVSEPLREKFGFRSVLSTAIFPKGDKPWILGLHQCSYARAWTPEEERLFQEIGRRLSDGLTGLLAYRNLQKSEEKYRRIVETASEGIWMIGPESLTSFVNPRMAAMLGYSVDEMLGRHPSEFIPEDEMPDQREKMSARARGGTETYERRFLRKDGQIMWGLASATPIYDEKQEFQGSFAMLTDITERKRAEADLIKAKEAAEYASRVKSRFLDIAAHELRTPVTAFSIMLELAQKQAKKGQPPEPDILHRLWRQSLRLNRLVVDLLDVSRLERGKLTLRRTPTNLISLIDTCVDECRLQAPGRSIVFAKPDCPIHLALDPVRIQQVLSNLLDNAIKYTPENCAVEVTAEILPEWVRVSVTDHGEGIPEEQRTELFKPFTRGDTDREERSSGLGLGLYVCDGIVKLHGGAIGVRSQWGMGSTFFFELPRKVDQS